MAQLVLAIDLPQSYVDDLRRRMEEWATAAARLQAAVDAHRPPSRRLTLAEEEDLSRLGRELNSATDHLTSFLQTGPIDSSATMIQRTNHLREQRRRPSRVA